MRVSFNPSYGGSKEVYIKPTVGHGVARYLTTVGKSAIAHMLVDDKKFLLVISNIRIINKWML